MRKLWTSDSPINHHGEFYRVEGGYSDIKPYQQPCPPLFFGGSSVGALEMGARHCDVFAIFGEPLKETRERVQDFRRRAAAFGRHVGFNMSLRPIMAETEGRHGTRPTPCWRMSSARPAPRAADQPFRRTPVGYAARGDGHDERLWMGIARATGAPQHVMQVGTPEQIAAAVLEYYRLGIHSFLLRGFENPHDTMAIGRDLIPLIKQGALAIDRQAKPPSRAHLKYPQASQDARQGLGCSRRKRMKEIA